MNKVYNNSIINMEIWKSIPGFSRYEASNLGNVRSLNYKRTGRTQLIKPALTDGYYKSVYLNDMGQYRQRRTHILVMLAFVGPCPDGMEINHKDGDGKNNNLSNLEYITHAENIKHSYDNGLQKPLRVSSNGNSKLTEEQVIEIRNYVSNFKGRYYGRKQLAIKYGVSEYTIKELVINRKNRKKSWEHAY